MLTDQLGDVHASQPCKLIESLFLTEADQIGTRMSTTLSLNTSFRLPR